MGGEAGGEGEGGSSIMPTVNGTYYFLIIKTQLTKTKGKANSLTGQTKYLTVFFVRLEKRLFC